MSRSEELQTLEPKYRVKWKIIGFDRIHDSVLLESAYEELVLCEDVIVFSGKRIQKSQAKLSAGAVSSLLIAIILTGGNVHAKEVNRQKAVIHHTASHDVSAETIDKWHRERGWDGIGYHFVIRKDGSVEKGRSLSKIGAHARGRNDWIGIVLTGYDSFTLAQTESLTRLLSDLGVKEIERHHEQCPGEGLVLPKIGEGVKDEAHTSRLQ